MNNPEREILTIKEFAEREGITVALRASQALEADTRMELKELKAPTPTPPPEQETGQPERRHNWLYRLFAKKG